MNPIRSGILGIVLMLGIMPAFAIDIAQKPVFLNPPDPRVMLVMSRDHELSKKAYNDHSDLDGDGTLPGVRSGAANRPTELPADFADVKRAVFQEAKALAR